MAFRTLECPIFKPFIGGCHAHYFHLRRAFWAGWHQVDVRNGSGIAAPCLRREHYRTLSHRNAQGSLSVMYLDTICFPVELCKTAHFPESIGASEIYCPFSPSAAGHLLEAFSHRP
jgi:hypothetical protein